MVNLVVEKKKKKKKDDREAWRDETHSTGTLPPALACDLPSNPKQPPPHPAQWNSESQG
jgi:hypothetical protein